MVESIGIYIYIVRYPFQDYGGTNDHFYLYMMVRPL